MPRYPAGDPGCDVCGDPVPARAARTFRYVKLVYRNIGFYVQLGAAAGAAQSAIRPV